MSPGPRAPAASKDAKASVDRLTLAAIGVVAYAVADVAHEAVGHGSACLLARGRPLELNASFLRCGGPSMTDSGQRFVAAGGSIASALVAYLAWLALRRSRALTAGSERAPTSGQYFAWLLMTVSSLQAAGYLFFSGVADVGDWSAVVSELEPAWLYRVALAVVGAGAYAALVAGSVRSLAGFVGGGEDRVQRARVLMSVPYLAGGALALAAGALNPLGGEIVVISAAASSLGGTSALAWSHNLLRTRYPMPPSAAPLVLARSVSWLAAAAVIAVVFVVVLGRSVVL